jgi:hypothetical protein
MYLLIKNAGIAPIEGFTVLGVSTARGNSDKIGMFGSGLKLGLNLLLRSGLNPVVFLGNKRLTFFTKPAFMGDKQYNRVCYEVDGVNQETGFSLEFGALDWDNVEMALREIVSNAIDAVGIEGVELDIVSEAKPFEDSTSFYIQLTPEVQRYYSSIGEKFLHFTGKHVFSVLEKNGVSDVNIYRKGVYVRTINTFTKSMFDYNFGDDVKIDESRNMNDSSCVQYAANALGKNKEMLTKYFKTLKDTQKLWEDSFYYWNFDQKLVLEVSKEVFGNYIPCSSEAIAKNVREKGYAAVVVRNIELLKNCGVKTGEDYLTKVETEGYSVKKATSETVKVLNKVWRKLEGIGLTGGKQKPNVMSFTGVAVNGGTTRGYYKDGTIYINVDDQGSFQTVAEECAHYITGATDGSRDFQEFAFNMACRLVKEWN